MVFIKGILALILIVIFDVVVAIGILALEQTESHEEITEKDKEEFKEIFKK